MAAWRAVSVAEPNCTTSSPAWGWLIVPMPAAALMTVTLRIPPGTLARTMASPVWSVTSASAAASTLSMPSARLIEPSSCDAQK